MDGINRTGGIDAALQAAALQARRERMAQEMGKYTYPGVVQSDPPGPGQRPAPVVPVNLAQLRLWVEESGGGTIDVLA